MHSYEKSLLLPPKGFIRSLPERKKMHFLRSLLHPNVNADCRRKEIKRKESIFLRGMWMVGTGVFRCWDLVHSGTFLLFVSDVTGPLCSTLLAGCATTGPWLCPVLSFTTSGSSYSGTMLLFFYILAFQNISTFFGFLAPQIKLFFGSHRIQSTCFAEYRTRNIKRLPNKIG